MRKELLEYALTLTTLWADSSDDKLVIFFFLFFLGNSNWHFSRRQISDIFIYSCGKLLEYALTLTTLWADSSDDKLVIFFLFFLENSN